MPILARRYRKSAVGLAGLIAGNRRSGGNRRRTGSCAGDGFLQQQLVILPAAQKTLRRSIPEFDGTRSRPGMEVSRLTLRRVAALKSTSVIAPRTLLGSLPSASVRLAWESRSTSKISLFIRTRAPPRETTVVVLATPPF